MDGKNRGWNRLTDYDNLCNGIEDLKQRKRWNITRSLKIFTLQEFHSDDIESTWTERNIALVIRNENLFGLTFVENHKRWKASLLRSKLISSRSFRDCLNTIGEAFSAIQNSSRYKESYSKIIKDWGYSRTWWEV